MMFKNTLVLAMAAAITSTSGCKSAGHGDLQDLRWLENANPIADAKKALAGGDHRLRGVYGLGLQIPGTELKDFEFYKLNYGINGIAGTTDALQNEEHHRLVQLAHNYAATYNRHIISEYKPQALLPAP